MSFPSKEEARELLFSHVTDPYQRLHAHMVATCVEGYAKLNAADEHLWWVTGYLHDIDYELYPTAHPGPSLDWFKLWGYPEEMIHAVEAHAFGFNGFTTRAETPLAKTLIACDEICGIFYAYQKLNPIPFHEMKASSIKKRVVDERFAPGISRAHIMSATEQLGVPIDTHIKNILGFLSADTN